MSAATNVRSIETARTAPARETPAAPQVEAAVLYSAMSPEMRTPELVAALALLRPEHFFVPQNARVFEAVQALLAEGASVDRVLLCERLRAVPAPVGGWMRYLSETIAIDGVHAEAPASEYASVLLEKWRLRETIRIGENLIAQAHGNAESVGLGGQARDALTALARAHSTDVPAATTYDTVHDAWETIAVAQSGKVVGVSWGFQGLDARLGRLQQPSYIIVGGRSGQGKTQLGWQTCLNLATTPADPETGLREGAYIAEFEMHRKPFLLRGICIEADWPMKRVQSGDIPAERVPWRDGAQCPACGRDYRFDTYNALPSNSRNAKVCRSCAVNAATVDAAPEVEAMPSPLERINAAAAMISSAPIFIDDQPCCPRVLADRFKRVRDLAAEGKMKTRAGREYPKCMVRTMVLDSIQDTPAPPGPSQRNRTTEIQDASRSVMNDLVKGCNIAVIALAKLTRAIDKQKDRRPQLSDIRECGDIEYHADEIAFVHREQYYLRDKTPPEQRNIAEIIHGKGRGGLDLEAPPMRLWFAGGMFFDTPPEGWEAWRARHNIPEGT